MRKERSGNEGEERKRGREEMGKKGEGLREERGGNKGEKIEK